MDGLDAALVSLGGDIADLIPPMDVQQSSTGNSSLNQTITSKHFHSPDPEDPSGKFMPQLTPFCGDFGFEIGFYPNEKNTHTMDWAYSGHDNKLHVKSSTECPILYKTSTIPPPGSLIRAMLIFKNPDRIQEPVIRCPNHTRDPEFRHLMTCNDMNTVYMENPMTGRHSLLLDASKPQPGAEWVANIFVFNCLTSCIGRARLGATTLMLTLEHHGQILGRKVVDVHISACPGREMLQKAGKSSKCIAPTLYRGIAGRSQSVEKKCNIDDGTTDEVFKVIVRGRKEYDMLCQIRDALELVGIKDS